MFVLRFPFSVTTDTSWTYKMALSGLGIVTVFTLGIVLFSCYKEYVYYDVFYFQPSYVLLFCSRLLIFIVICFIYFDVTHSLPSFLIPVAFRQRVQMY